MVSLLCSSRSGSTSLSLYLSKIFDLKLETLPFIKEREISSLEDDIFYKILIHQQAKGYDSLFEFGEPKLDAPPESTCRNTICEAPPKIMKDIA